MAGRKKENTARVEVQKTPTGYNFRLRITINGKRYSKGLGLTTQGGKRSADYLTKKKEAEQIAEIEQAKLRTASYGTTPELLRQVSLHAYLDTYVKTYTRKDIRRTRAMATRAKAFFTVPTYLHTLTAKDCEEFCNTIKDELKSDTARGYVQAFKKALEYAVQQKYLIANPAKGITVKTKHDRLVKNVLTTNELQTLEKTPCGNDEVKRAFLFSCLTGLGYADCKALKWENLHHEDGKTYLQYKRLKTKNEVKVKLGKAAGYFVENGTPYIFTNLPTNNAANKVLRYWLKRAGIAKAITFYSARHTFGTRQAINGANIVTIAKNMGHSSTAHTAKYVNHVREAQDKAVEAAEW